MGALLASVGEYSYVRYATVPMPSGQNAYEHSSRFIGPLRRPARQPRELPLFRRGLHACLGGPENVAKMPRSVKKAIGAGNGGRRGDQRAETVVRRGALVNKSAILRSRHGLQLESRAGLQGPIPLLRKCHPDLKASSIMMSTPSVIHALQFELRISANSCRNSRDDRLDSRPRLHHPARPPLRNELHVVRCVCACLCRAPLIMAGHTQHRKEQRPNCAMKNDKLPAPWTFLRFLASCTCISKTPGCHDP